ncbi:hypothetical protein [Nocardioides lacusdianchii]|uniref:hypothetical protein n=1 Tax=Nocardioides lacusdianchii TaxID=2783664 RepID=UPI001CC9C8DC|nr:hypothetical protein [Nocardioides lacusdianchii]
MDEAEGVCRERFESYVDALPAGSGVELRPYLDGGIERMRDLGTDETRWTGRVRGVERGRSLRRLSRSSPHLHTSRGHP